MKQNLTITLAATAIASALALPAWSQPTTNVTGASTGATVTTPSPTIGANADASAQARMRAECFNSATNVWRTTGNCANVSADVNAMASTRAPMPPTASAPSTYPGTVTKPTPSSHNPGSLKDQTGSSMGR